MIRHIVAVDSKLGIAKDHAMPPWNLSTDEAYFTEKTLTQGGNVLMGKKTFTEALKNHPLKERHNYVVSHDTEQVSGVTIVSDLQSFVANWPADKDLWIIGGAEIFAQTIGSADELYITEIDGDFQCDRFYPAYEGSFKLVQDSEVHTENGTDYVFRVYVPR